MKERSDIKVSVKIFPTLKNYKKEYLPKDILSGIIMAAVSIPISMGYAQIAGVPAVYGLYGSVLPILLFAMLSTSKQFIFGVDAAPAALIGSALLGMRSCTGNTWSDGRISPGIAVCTIDLIIYRTLVIVVLSFTCR